MAASSHATTTVGARLAARICREAETLRRRLRAAGEAEVEGVHQARVASRRLREMLALVATVDARDVRRLRRDIRRLAQTLGPLRELAVAQGIWHEAEPEGRWPTVVVTRLDRQAAADREARIAAVRRAMGRIDRTELRDRSRALAEVLTTPVHERRLTSGLAGRVRRRSQDLVQAVTAAGTLYAVEPLHETRLAVKKLRYSVELVRDLTDVPVRPAVRQLKRQQDLLGRLHDLQVVQERLQAIASDAGTSRAVIRSIQISEASLELECRELHATFVAGATRLLELCQALRAQMALTLVRPRARRMTDAASAEPDREQRVAAGGHS